MTSVNHDLGKDVTSLTRNHIVLIVASQLTLAIGFGASLPMIAIVLDSSGVATSNIAYILSLNMLFTIIITYWAGRLSDRYRKDIVFLCLSLCVVFSFVPLAIESDSPWLLAVSRAIGGFNAALMPMIAILLHSGLTADLSKKALAWSGAAMSLGFIIGPIVFSSLTVMFPESIGLFFWMVVLLGSGFSLAVCSLFKEHNRSGIRSETKLESASSAGAFQSVLPLVPLLAIGFTGLLPFFFLNTTMIPILTDDFGASLETALMLVTVVYVAIGVFEGLLLPKVLTASGMIIWLPRLSVLGVALLLVAVLFQEMNLFVLYFFVSGVMMAFTIPHVFSHSSDYCVERENTSTLMAYVSMTMSFSRFLSPLLGGFLFYLLGLWSLVAVALISSFGLTVAVKLSRPLTSRAAPGASLNA